MKKVLLSEKIDDVGIKLLQDNEFTVTVSPSTDAETMKKEIRDAYAVIMRSSALTKDIIDAGKELKIISRNGTGINNVDVNAATANHVLVAKVNGANAYAVAEYVISTMLLLSRRLLTSDHLLHEKKNELKGLSLPGFSTEYGLNGHEIKGKTLAILGLGHIGQVLAKLAQAFGMNVIGYDPYLKTAPVPLLGSLTEIYKQADFISVNMPLTSETRDMISAKEMALMKPTTCIINSARGGIINEQDLATALNNDKLGGAAIDSFSPEPPQPDNPLFSSKHTLLTTHLAGTTLEANQALGIGAAQAIIDFSNGKMPQFPVNPEVFKKGNSL
ncbi:MAG: hydroxyacid dehydrogenase [Furfurilactobacillus sp.]|uniref:Hydroxyacid dehydrogenase n=1 Tax=Furfurilactobacillus milii TaxID=2888272 RepID=A0ABT6D6I0_9LACO|nr:MULTISPECIES: hydroxyacid dehydrogenase [Furfurilactobacillus]QLE66325.1 lactate dehydrogenase related enzyme [Furfurilactobacillus rossiae]MCF6159781.1 hydroxyacid dehydrogenase [Furfurilactobacillus milii]MCF6163134.1 hydroxyacid dehydrogenase [Furfurilactobacillus milii]MCF6419160.1 hydroxyacid dehydrogenase [Furfurilactobacillus milii]MCH4010963.1 hydroxyacid dehydrogenase [Furfurilactobacillus sp.]